MTVKDELAGRKGKCPACQGVITIPSASPSPSHVPAEAVAEPKPKPKPRPKPPEAAPEPRPVKASTPKPAREVNREASPNTRPRPPLDEDEEDEDYPRRRKPAGVNPEVAAVLDRTEWYVREDQGLFSGNTLAGLYESPEAKEPIAVIRDATYKLFGLINLDVPLLRARTKIEVRVPDKTGPVALTLERFAPTFEIPFTSPKPIRWEVRDGAGEVVGSFTLSRQGFSLFKLLTRGQFFQEEHFVLDPEGEQVGLFAIERKSMLAIPKRVMLLDNDGVEYGVFGTQLGRKVGEMLDEAKRTGAGKVKISVNVLGKGDEDEQGFIGRVNPARTGDAFARMMTFAVTILLEVIGFGAFSRAKGVEAD